MEQLERKMTSQELAVIEEVDSSSERMPTPQSRKMGAAAIEGFSRLPNPEDLDSNHSIREKMQNRVIGQPAAVEAVIKAMDRQEVRLNSDNRPIASFAFLGPTGVGKTETAKALAEAIAYEGDEPNLIHINCTEYKANHDVSRLLGSSPSYIGYGDETVLNPDNVRENTVVLFDEIEKGAPAIRDVLMQIMDEGRLETGDGTEIFFRDAVVIMTSNLGAEQMTETIKGSGIGFQFDQKEVDYDRIDDAARSAFGRKNRTEFINRITEQVVFRPLERDALDQILDVKLNAYNEEYGGFDNYFKVSLSDQAREQIVSKAYEERHLGARPLVRQLESSIISRVGQYYGSGLIENSSHVKVFHKDEFGEGDDSSELIFASQYDPALEVDHERREYERRRNQVQASLHELEKKNPSISRR